MTVFEIGELVVFLMAIIAMTIFDVHFLKHLLKYYEELQEEVKSLKKELERYENKFVLLETKVNKSNGIYIN